MKLPSKTTVLLLSLMAAASSRGTVYFQNTGTLSGWTDTSVQQQGEIYSVSNPTWDGGTALAFEQTFTGALTGYHSEVIKASTQSNGQDRYYGKVIRLPSNWVFHDKNDTFQQFSPENPEGPWMLNWIQNSNLYIQTKNGSGNANLGAIAANVWVRIVVRLNLKTSGGAHEVWINGTKKLSQTNFNFQVPGTTLRWSNGIYCTGWRTAAPAAGDATQRTLYQDHFRVASTYAEAEPANWSSGVRFYQSINYGGTSSQVLAKGSYTMSQLNALGVPNDWASSVKIPSGWTLILYQGNNFTGTSWTRTSDTPDFTALSPSANDQMSSCVIQ